MALSLKLCGFLFSPLEASSLITEEESIRTPHHTTCSSNVEICPLSDLVSTLDDLTLSPQYFKRSEEGMWLSDELYALIFLGLPTREYRSASCVSTTWHDLLQGDAFLTTYNSRFLPSKASSVRMTPQEFVRYWITPSFVPLLPMGFRDIHALNREAWELMLLQTASVIVNPYMSADGAIIAASLQMDAKKTAVKLTWDACSSLKTFSEGSPSEVSAMSANGAVIGGHVEAPSKNRENIQVKWVNSDKGDDLIPLEIPENAQVTAIRDCSADGSIIVGVANITGWNHGIKWTPDGFVLLDHIHPNGWSVASRISSDGSTIIGWERQGNKRSAVSWTQKGATSLESLGAPYTEANFVNKDGSVILGKLRPGTGNNQSMSVHWTKDGVHPTGCLSEVNGFYMRSITPDTSVMVGVLDKQVAFIRNDKIFILQDELEAAGVLLEDWKLTNARAISANGLQFLGTAEYNNKSFAFKAVLPANH